MGVRLHNGYTQAYAQIMQHTHMHKAVTGRVEAKKLLSRRRQSNSSVVHMHNNRNLKKGFFESECDLQKLGVKTCLFSRKGTFFNSIKGRLGVIFSNSSIPQNVFKIYLFRGKIDCKTMQNSCLGMFFS